MEMLKPKKWYDRTAVDLDTGEESPVQQHFREQTNIQRIMEKYQRTGMAPLNKLNPQYGDFSGGRSFHESLNKIREAEQEFEKLPGNVKKRFSQDPGEILDFLADEKNREEAEKMGLIPRKMPEVKKVGDPIEEPEEKPVKKSKKTAFKQEELPIE